MDGSGPGVLSWLEHASLRLRVMVGVALIAGGLAIGFVAGVGGGPNLDGARAAGQRAGAAEARERGSAQGYAAGLARGTREGSVQTYGAAYREAYRKALAEAGGG